MTHRYGVIVADPPWQFSDKLTMSDVKRGARANYQTMKSSEIAALNVGRCALDNAVLALWCPSSMLEDGLKVMKWWGFTHKQVITWVKTATGPSGLALGMGHHFRNCTEHVLFGVRGKVRPSVRNQRNVMMDPATKHSVKPETLQNLLEMMYRGPYLELFARRERPGWVCLGNEINGVDIRECL